MLGDLKDAGYLFSKQLYIHDYSSGGITEDKGNFTKFMDLVLCVGIQKINKCEHKTSEESHCTQKSGTVI